MKATETNKEVIDNFIIEALTTDPIRKIIEELKNDKLGDKDIPYLNCKLETYTEIAMEMFNIHVNGMKPPAEGILNDYTKTIYIQIFQSLYMFFKSFSK